jgi:hypothetical protein
MSYVALSAECCGQVAPVISPKQKVYKMSSNRNGVRAEREVWRFCAGMPCYVKGWPQEEYKVIAKAEGFSWPTYIVQFQDGMHFTVSQLYLSKRPLDQRK